MNRQIVKALVFILTALMAISMVPIVSIAQHPSVSMWLDPSSVELNTAEHSIGYKFWITVWLNATGYEVGSWQFYMIYNKNYLNITQYTLTGTGGTISQFFENSGSSTFYPGASLGAHNDTHNYILMGESWLSGPFGTGCGTLATLEFEVIAVPPKGGEITSLIDISTGFAAGDTLVQDPTMANILQAAYDCTYAFTWVQPPEPYLGVSPVSQEFGMFDNVTGWPVDVSIYIMGLDAAWYLVNASFTFSYDPALVSVTADNITLNTADWDVAAQFSISNGNITFYVETSKDLYGDVKVADITFTIIYQGDYPEVSVCELKFYDIHLFDHAIEIPTKAPLEGEIRIVGFIALPMPHLEVSPSEVVMGPEPSLGKEFSVDVVMKGLYEAWHLVGYNFRLKYDDTLLEVVDVQEGSFLADTTSWGYVLLKDITLPAAAPPLYMSNITLILRVNASMPGTYDFEIVAPTGIRVLINGAPTTTFSISALPAPYSENVTIEFRNYNTYPITGDYKIICSPTTYGVTLFNVTDPANPIELEWIRNVAAPPYTWFFSGVEPDGIYGPHVAVGGMVATDTGEWYIFPEGEGVLATITFKVLKQPKTGENLSCALDLFDIILIDKDGKDIPYEPPVNGTYTILGYELPGRQIDVYTQYPEPYGGQGPNNPSDMFTPQQEVKLYAKVTYNWWGMENKLVAFEVLDNQNNTFTRLSALTDSNGIAEVSFRMPSYNPDLFGVWTVIATVDIAEETINDTLQFHFDTLVEIVDISPDKLICSHGDTITITVTLESHAMQPRDVVVAILITDELGFTVAFGTAQLTVSDAEFCTPNEYEVSVTLTIPHEAVAGMATIHVNCFDKDPAEGGIALCPESTYEIFIQPY